MPPCLCFRCKIDALAFLVFSRALLFSLFFLKLIFLYEYVCDICNKCLVIICFMASWSSLPSLRMLVSQWRGSTESRPAILLWVGLPHDSCCVFPSPDTSSVFQRLDLPLWLISFYSMVYLFPVPCNNNLYLLPSLCHLALLHTAVSHSLVFYGQQKSSEKYNTLLQLNGCL